MGNPWVGKGSDKVVDEALFGVPVGDAKGGKGLGGFLTGVSEGTGLGGFDEGVGCELGGGGTLT